ncbi:MULTISPECIES: RCC1 domain-containing protein [Caldanaerobacter]
MWAWGANYYGQLGNGTTRYINHSVEVKWQSN